MNRLQSIVHTNRYRNLLSACVVGACCVFSSTFAHAHFVLMKPDATMMLDNQGNPQKAEPCGGQGMASGLVTSVQAGETVDVIIDETVFHPGHYRIAIATNDPSELPANPEVTPGQTACGTAAIQNPPVFPVLADGVFAHTEAFSTTAPCDGSAPVACEDNQPCPQCVRVTIPADVTCTNDNCTLQILEFMSEHGAPCFYYHCSDLSIEAATADAGVGGAGDGGAAGNETGGAGGTGGTVSEAGSGGAVAQAGSSATGGVSAGGSASGGSSGSGGSVATGGTSGTSNPEDGDSGDGGGCSVALGSSSSTLPALLGMALSLFAFARRNRK